MTTFDWTLVVLLNASIIAFGLWLARGTRSSVDWFLAARGLPWWIVGLSMFATAVDSGDYVAVAGGAYDQGLAYISAWWLGLSVGWCLLSYVVLVPLFKAGMFTNAEYLEYRFGPAARVISVFIQIQSRTNVLANVAFSLFLTFSVLTQWGDQTWWLVVAIAGGAALYTASGGLRSVAVTDTLQSVVMLFASMALWWTVWTAIGGWSGLEENLGEHVASGRLTAETARATTHVGGYNNPDVPPALVVLGFVVVLSSYCVINQSQTMRLLASRSLWDMKMAAVAAGVVTSVVMWFNVTLGLMGRAVLPELDTPDQIFPELIKTYLPTLQAGLLGLVVAGLLAGGISTYDSVGSAVASVFTRDIYARFLVKSNPDRHYLKVSRIVTFVVIGGSFAYVPFLKSGMIAFYMKLSGVAVVPLLTVYLMGTLTRVARESATVGLVVGIVCGLSRFCDPLFERVGLDALPVWWSNTWWGYPWSIALTAAAMVVTSFVRGWATREEVQGLTFFSARAGEKFLPRARSEDESVGWLESSRAMLPEVPDTPFPSTGGKLCWCRQPLLWAGLLLLAVAYLNLVVFW